MSMYVPDSTIKVYDAKIDTNTGRTMAFTTAAEREAYFADCLVASDIKCSVIKKQYQTLKVSIPYATIENCDYISFVNPSYGNKIYYGRIRSVSWENPNLTKITYTIDWWLTDMFSITFDPTTSIVREGLTISENVAIGNNPYVEVRKLRTAEPLSCDRETEPVRYDIRSNMAVNNVADGWNVFTVPLDATQGNNPLKDTTPVYVICVTDCGETVMLDVYDAITEHAKQCLIVSPYRGYTFHSVLAGYAWAQHTDYSGQGDITSTSSQPLSDTSMARPYFMFGTTRLDDVTGALDVLNGYDAVSAVLSVQTFPMYLLDEFVASGFTDPAQSIVNANYVRIPFPTAYAGSRGFNTNYGSPKLYRFPFAYASIEGVNGSGHIELKYEKMGKIDPTVDNLGTLPTLEGVRVDEQGKPTYFTLRKYVSITADGIYMGVAPVDYENRIVGTDYEVDHGSISKNVRMVKSDLTHGVFYTEFPQVPFTTDAYYAFLAQQAKSALIAETGLAQSERAASYDALYRQGTTNKINLASSLLGNAVSGLTSGSDDYGKTVSSAVGIVGGVVNYAADEANRNQQMDIIRQQANLAVGANEYMSNPQVANDFTKNFANAKAAFVAPNYHAGSSGGAINMLKDVEQIGVTVLMHRRSERYLESYAKFFKYYGYAAEDFKIPAISHYINNQASHNDAPQWELTDDNENVFYTKTDNIHITGVNSESAAFIENMFNGGVLFTKYVPSN